MEYVYIGKIVNTHGIKGELRILSKFEYKDKVFKKDMLIYLGKDKKEVKIKTYRVHKNFDMVTLYNFDNINQVLMFKGMDVYVLKEDISLNENEYLDKDLIGLKVFIDGRELGIVSTYSYTGGNNKIIEVKTFNERLLLPIHNDIIKSIDLVNKTIDLVDLGVVEGE